MDLPGVGPEPAPVEGFSGPFDPDELHTHSDLRIVTPMRVGIVGASGYTGAELLRLAAAHPEMEVVLATGDTQAGTAVPALYPSLRPVYGDLTFAEYTPEVVEGLDLVFCGLPHGASQAIVP